MSVHILVLTTIPTSKATTMILVIIINQIYLDDSLLKYFVKEAALFGNTKC
jgi:hypothetical protein